MKKRPAKPSKTVSAPEPQEAAKPASSVILYTAPGIPAGLSPHGYIPKGETDWRRFHEINVRDQNSGICPKCNSSAGVSDLGSGALICRRYKCIPCGKLFDEVGPFVLYDRDEPCGPRLIKGAGFPLYDTTEIAIWVYANLKEASVAADMLQDYLDNYENKHLEVARKRYEKENALITA